MKKFKNNLNKLVAASILLSGILCSACSDTWDDHYDSTTQNAADKTLWEAIESRSDLQSFAKYLKETGYDKILNSSQMYTVWAPTGQIDTTGMSSNDILKEVVQNHIARYAYSATPSLSTKVLMLNNKIMTFAQAAQGYSFSDASLSSQNIIAKNGILHIINKQAAYFSNLWEVLKESQLDSIKKFMYSFTTEKFDEEHSIESGVVDGQTIYSDSVMIESNILWDKLGSLSKEDSSYYFIVPTNKAWRSAYDNISKYYVFETTNAKRDSLQTYYTKYAIVKDLIYSTANQVSPKDSVISTSKTVFKNPEQGIFAEFPGFWKGQTGKVCSNGFVFITDTLRFNAWETWQKEIKTECENTNLRSDYTGCNVYTRDVPTGSKYKVSSGRYVEVIPTSSAVNPTITYDLPNTLSAAYDIYCIFVPPYVANANTKTAKPSIVRFQLSYHKETGAVATFALVDTVFKSSLTNIDTVLVAENFKFPVANYNQDNTTVNLKIMTNVKRNQTTEFTRTIMLDCVYLKPHH